MIRSAVSLVSGMQAVEPGAIDKELQTLWRRQAEQRQRSAPGERPVGRTLLHTLVVFAPDPATAAQALDTIGALDPHEPGRLILLAMQPDVQSEFKAAVRLNCVAPEEGHAPVCCEQIVFTAGGVDAVRRLPGAVLPLLVTDVPSFVYWTRGNPFRSPLLADLAPVIDRLIVDSFTFSAPDPDLADVAAAVEDPRFPAIVSDLSWARLAAWRYQTAQIFDPANMRPYLRRVRRARVSYYAGTPVLAWLFGGWLSSRLGWKCVERDVQGARYAMGQVLEYEVLPPPEPGVAGYFAGLRLTADDGANFEVMRTGATFAHTCLKVGELTLERTVPLKLETPTEWLGHELGRLSPVPTYNAALGQLVEGARAGAAYAG